MRPRFTLRALWRDRTSLRGHAWSSARAKKMRPLPGKGTNGGRPSTPGAHHVENRFPARYSGVRHCVLTICVAMACALGCTGMAVSTGTSASLGFGGVPVVCPCGMKGTAL
eukprot:scaffold921_cov397-Prasinococcus_capsulatus_cf.AAC.4